MASTCGYGRQPCRRQSHWQCLTHPGVASQQPTAIGGLPGYLWFGKGWRCICERCSRYSGGPSADCLLRDGPALRPVRKWRGSKLQRNCSPRRTWAHDTDTDAKPDTDTGAALPDANAKSDHHVDAAPHGNTNSANSITGATDTDTNPGAHGNSSADTDTVSELSDVHLDSNRRALCN